MTTPAFLYARFSSARQDKDATIERQLGATRRMCEENGWEVVEPPLIDKGRSAWKGDHLRVGELGRFKQQIDDGQVPSGSVLVIENFDRLSRQDVKKARRWIEEVTDAGIKVAVANLNKVFDDTSLSGENIIDLLQYLLEAQRSTKESERKSVFQKDAIARFMDKARKGVVYNSHGPAWLAGTKDGKFEVIEDRAEIVRQIYQWAADGLGFASIAKKLNASVEPWTAAHKSVPSWKPGYIRDILKNPAAEGEYHVRTGPDRQPTGEIIHNYYHRVVPAELVAAARASMLHRQGTTSPNVSEARNLFTGKVKCGHCGDTMIRIVQRNRHKKQYEYLKCVRVNNGAGCSNRTVYRYDVFERAALNEILSIALEDRFFVVRNDLAPLIAKVAELKKQVENMQAEQQRLLGFVMRNPDATEAEEMLNQMRPELNAKKAEFEKCEQELNRAKGSVSPDEHLARVAEVREAIYSEDKDEREQARRKVRDALKEIVSVVSCQVELPLPSSKSVQPNRSITMALVGGSIAYMFNNEGKQIKPRIDLTSDKNVSRIVAGTGQEQMVAPVRRRLKKLAEKSA